jgi:hypothetical protein
MVQKLWIVNEMGSKKIPSRIAKQESRATKPVEESTIS